MCVHIVYTVWIYVFSNYLEYYCSSGGRDLNEDHHKSFYIAVGALLPGDVQAPGQCGGCSQGQADLRQGTDPSAESSILSESVADRPTLLN